MEVLVNYWEVGCSKHIDVINVKEIQNNFHVMTNRRIRKRFIAGEENKFICSLNAEG